MICGATGGHPSWIGTGRKVGGRPGRPGARSAALLSAALIRATQRAAANPNRSCSTSRASLLVAASTSSVLAGTGESPLRLVFPGFPKTRCASELAMRNYSTMTATTGHHIKHRRKRARRTTVVVRFRASTVSEVPRLRAAARASGLSVAALSRRGALALADATLDELARRLVEAQKGGAAA